MTAQTKKTDLSRVSAAEVCRSISPVSALRVRLQASGGISTIVLPVVPLVVIGSIWQIMASRHLVNPLFYGEPSAIARELVRLLSTRLFYTNLWSTTEATLLGFVIGSAAGIAVAALMSLSRTVDRTVGPWMAMLNSMPRIALAPLFILWLGLGQPAKIATGVTLVFFIVATSTLGGLKIVDRDQMLLSQSLGFNKMEILRKLRLPTALPGIFAGFRLGLAYTLLGIVGAEMIAAKEGLGILITTYSNAFDISAVFAVLIIVMVLALVLVAALNMIERRMLAWNE